MNDLDTLRPEVREALWHIRPASRARFQLKSWETIRAELLRLVGENKRMRGIIETLDIEGHRRAEKAEAGLAAVKARIAGSRHAFLGPNMDRITFLADEIGPSGKYALVKVEE